MEKLTREDRIHLDFLVFHYEHPDVYAQFCRFVDQLVEHGHKRYSADAVLHRVRWETSLGYHGDGGYKINNNFTAYYARMYMSEHPDRNRFFEIRVLNSRNR